MIKHFFPIPRIYLSARQMVRLVFFYSLQFFPTTLYRGAGIRTKASQKSCTRQGPLKEALPAELLRRSSDDQT